MRGMGTRAPAVWLAAAALAAAGCGDEEEEPRPAAEEPAPTRAAPQGHPSQERSEPEPEPERKPGPEPRTLTECLRESPGVRDVLVKGRDSEDTRYFEELVGGRVTVIAITLEGQSGEADAFVFDSAADARRAAPGAGGAGLNVTVHGRAVLVAPPAAETGAIESCLARDA
jgi:hypothetical protein